MDRWPRLTLRAPRGRACNRSTEAISVFKNPARRRRVSLDDPTEAAEVVLFADLLLRIVDRATARIQT